MAVSITSPSFSIWNGFWIAGRSRYSSGTPDEPYPVEKMKGRLRAFRTSATGVIKLPFRLTSRIARSKSVLCASVIASSRSPA